jgi:hypothetical protein
MRIRDGDAAAGEKTSHLDELVDHRLVGAAGLAVLLDHPLAGEKRQVGPEGRVVEDVERHPEPVLQPDLEVVVAVAGRGMDEARARVVGDMLAGQERHVELPFAARAFGPAQRVGAGQRCKLVRRHRAQAAAHGRVKPHGR